MVKVDDTIIKDFEIPNHSLVSVNSKQKNANLQNDTYVYKYDEKWRQKL